MTLFGSVYNRFLGKITDDMYMELTPEDTIKDLQNLLIDSIPGFEFPRINLYNYEIKIMELEEDKLVADDFILGTVWGELSDTNISQIPKVIVDRSYFTADLTSEEINILAILMKQAWVQRQVTSVENTRMKYSGADFKLTSQANHLQKLMSLLEESKRDSLHMQRLYKRRKISSASGSYESNWSVLREKRVID